MKEIKGKFYPKEFADWMFSIYGREEFMPNDDTIWLWSIAFEAGRAIGYKQAREDCW